METMARTLINHVREQMIEQLKLAAPAIEKAGLVGAEELADRSNQVITCLTRYADVAMELSDTYGPVAVLNTPQAFFSVLRARMDKITELEQEEAKAKEEKAA